MLSICLFFDKTEGGYAYKRYAYRKQRSEELDFNIWLKIGTDSTSFRCKICTTNKDLALGQSGIGSL